MRRLGVLGWPVAHSRSPAIHNAALAALGMDDWRYQRLPVPPELLVRDDARPGRVGLRRGQRDDPAQAGGARAGRQRERGGGGDRRGEHAHVRPDGAIAAENTDAPGLIAALGGPPRGLRALVLGAGGSARAAAWALREAGASEVSVWNRTPERAEALARELGVRAVAQAGARGPARQLHLRGPAAGGRGAGDAGADAQPPGRLSGGRGPRLPGGPHRAAERRPAEQGSRTLDGLEILVAQGALSFELWTGRPAPLEVMRRAAREDGDDA